MRRRAVRYLHARDGAGRHGSASPYEEPDRGGDSRRIVRQLVPLHGIPANLRSGCYRLRTTMRSYLPEYELRAPKDLRAALDLLAAEWRPFAGGTDLMVLLESGKLPRGKYVSLWGLEELSGIEAASDAVTL